MIGEEFELEAIRAVAAADGDPDSALRESARAELLALIEHGASARGAIRPRVLKRRPRLPLPAWGLGAFSGLAAAITAAVVVLAHGAAVQPASAVAAVLERAARAPSLVTPVHLGPHQVWYVEQVWAGQTTQHPASCMSDCYETRVIRWWVGPSRYSMHQYVTSRSARLHRIRSAPPNRPMIPARYSPRWSGVGAGYDQLLHYGRMLTTSTSLGSLRWLMLHLPAAHITRPLPRWETEQLMFAGISGILSQPRVPARMLSGLYRLLATMPGASLRGRVRDTLGRPALELDYRLPVAPAQRGKLRLQWELLFDPRSFALLDTIQRTVSSSPKLPSSYAEMAYVNSGLVRRIGALPRTSSPRP